MDTEKDVVSTADTELDTEQFQLVVTKIDGKYIVLADGFENELSDIIGVIKNIIGDNVFVVNVDKDEYDEKKAFIDVLNDYIDSKLKA
jgi:hypothetical protein